MRSGTAASVPSRRPSSSSNVRRTISWSRSSRTMAVTCSGPTTSAQRATSRSWRWSCQNFGSGPSAGASRVTLSHARVGRGGPRLDVLLPVRGEDAGERPQGDGHVDVPGCQVVDDAPDHLRPGPGEELAADDDAGLAGPVDLANEPAPRPDRRRIGVGEGRRLAGNRPDRVRRVAAPAGVPDALLEQRRTRRVERGLEGGRAGLVRADVEQAGAVGKPQGLGRSGPGRGHGHSLARFRRPVTRRTARRRRVAIA